MEFSLPPRAKKWRLPIVDLGPVGVTLWGREMTPEVHRCVRNVIPPIHTWHKAFTTSWGREMTPEVHSGVRNVIPLIHTWHKAFTTSRSHKVELAYQCCLRSSSWHGWRGPYLRYPGHLQQTLVGASHFMFGFLMCLRKNLFAEET